MPNMIGLVEGPAQIDMIYQGKAQGPVASKLLANGLNINALRTNDILQYDEWKLIDTAVIEAAEKRMVGANDLISRGLVLDLGGRGMGIPVIQWQTSGSGNAASMDMSSLARGPADRIEYDTNYLPLPIIHKSFFFDIRTLDMGRRMGIPIDTAHAADAAIRIGEKVEGVLFNGASSYKFGGGTIRGYRDFDYRTTGSLAAAWTASAADPVQDIIDMKQDAINDRHYGDYGVYIPTAYESVLDKDYNATYPSGTIRNRILAIGGISFIRVADHMTAGSVVLVELQKSTVELVIGLPLTTVQWDVQGGLGVEFKLITIMIPRIRADQNQRSGIVHYSA